MSNLLEELGKVAGAVMAEQGVTKLDPDANFLEKAAAAIAGFEGTKLAENALGEKYQQYKDSEQQANQNADADDSSSDDNQADYQAEAYENNQDNNNADDRQDNSNEDDEQSDNS